MNIFPYICLGLVVCAIFISIASPALFNFGYRIFYNENVCAKTRFPPFLWWLLLMVCLTESSAGSVWSLVNNPNLSPQMIRYLYKSGRVSEEGVLRLVRRTSTPVDVIEDIGEKTFWASDIRLALLANSKVSEETRTFWALKWEVI